MRIITKGATDQSLYFEVLDSSATDGSRLTGLVYNTASLKAYYVRNGGSPTSISLATLAAANSAHSDGGFKEVDATNMPGVYRLDLPDAAVATGADSVVVTIGGAADMAQVSHMIQLTAVNLQDAVRGGMTALPNANAEAAGGLYTRGSGAGQIAQDANGRVNVNVAAIETADPSDTIRDAIVDDATRIDASALNTATGTTIPAILTDTAEIGAAGAGLTAVPWNASWDAEVQSECTDALNAYDPPTNTEMNARTLASADYASATDLGALDGKADDIKSVTEKLDDTLEDDGGTYRFTANALEEGPAGGGGGGATAEEVWEYATRTLTAGTNIALAKGTGITGFNDLDASGVRSAVGLASANMDTQLGALATSSALTTVGNNVLAVKSQSDKLTFGVANVLNSNVTHVNEFEVVGNGTVGNEWGPAA